MSAGIIWKELRETRGVWHLTEGNPNNGTVYGSVVRFANGSYEHRIWKDNRNTKKGEHIQRLMN